MYVYYVCVIYIYIYIYIYIMLQGGLAAKNRFERKSGEDRGAASGGERVSQSDSYY